MRSVAFSAAVAVMILHTVALAEEGSSLRVALVIGNNRPLHNADALRFADDDAVATDILLREAGVKSVLLVRMDETTRSLHSSARPFGAPRRAELERAQQLLTTEVTKARARGRRTELMVFYSGHGDVETVRAFWHLKTRVLHAVSCTSSSRT